MNSKRKPNLDLHTKYRPNALAAVVGQSGTVKALSEYKDSRRSHAFLFTGPSGVGKTTIARIMASELGCAHGDLQEVDGATFGNVEAVRELARGIYYMPMCGGSSKAIIVDECHALSKAAWQALLKSVEEPPEYVFWFFCTTEAGRVPYTIQTRCAKFDLQLIPVDLIYDRVVEVAKEEGLELADGVADVIADYANGSMRAALVGLSSCAWCETEKEAAEVLRQARPNDDSIAFIRYLARGENLTWKEAMRRFNKLGEVDAESLRISMCNYLARGLLNIKDDRIARRGLFMLECFSRPYHQATARGDLLMSIGEVVLGE